MKTPSIPPTFWTAIATAILGAAAAYGLPVTPKQSAAIMNIAEILPVTIIVAGTILHAVRAIFAGNVLSAKAVQAQAEAAYAKARDEARAATPEQKAAFRRILAAIVSAIVLRVRRSAPSPDASAPAE